jgi:transcriptional regulator with XRE-family HTH domain
MIIYQRVNPNLSFPAYVSWMRRKKPGSPKGQAKPKKRRLDAGFPKRLQAAMDKKGWNDTELAKQAGCTKAVIGQYLSGKKTNVDALLLFDIAEKLDVSARHLAKGDALPGHGKPLNRDQHRALDLHSALPTPWRADWLEQAEQIKRRLQQ